MKEFQTVIYHVEHSVANITINRPEKHNAMSLLVLRELQEAIARADDDESVNVMVLRGRGQVSFSAGIDLHGGILTDTDKIAEAMLSTLVPLFERIENSNKLIIASIEGTAVGLGCSLALHCDLLAMSERATLDLAFIKFGLIADGGINWQLPRKVGYGRALQMVLETQVLDADRCLNLGLANRVLKLETMDKEVTEWASKLASGPSVAQGHTKRLMRATMCGQNLLDTVRMEAESQANCADTEYFRKAFAGFLNR